MVMDILRQENGINVGQGLDGTCPSLIVDDADALIGCAFIHEVQAVDAATDF